LSITQPTTIILMASVATGVFLRVLHMIHSLVLLWRVFQTRFSGTLPKSLLFSRRRIPRHLAIIFVTDPSSSVPESESSLAKSVRNAINWCYDAGIEKLTIYEEHGSILKCLQKTSAVFGDDSGYLCGEMENKDPLAPSASRSKVPGPDTRLHMGTVTVQRSDDRNKRESRKHCTNQSNHHVSHTSPKMLTLCLASRDSAKPAIASIAASLVPRDKPNPRKKPKYGRMDTFTLSEDKLHDLLESTHTLSSPDVMIIHPTNPLRYNRTPLELHGFPPWHLKQTEIYHNRFQHPSMIMQRTTGDTPLDENTFRRALDEFSAAEMRFGK